MLDRETRGAAGEGDYVAFVQAGQAGKGSYQCSECGYGVVVTAPLPTCPMCGSTVWEESPWSPFGRSAAP
jgi:rubrerythrin